jgi:glycosyltransferase involved in cell wall biosynthesis
MKVLVATHSYSGNGAAVMLLSVLKHWVQDRKWIVDVLLDADRDVPNDLADVGANVFTTADPGDYDFAVVNTLVSAHLVESIGPRVPTVLWVHEAETALWNSQWSASQWRHLFGLAERVVFQTSWQRDQLFGSFLIGIPPARIKCVANGMPSLPFGLTAKPKANGKKRIVFMGGVYGRKRPQDLVDAVLALKRNDIECLLIGTTEALNSIGSEHVAKIQAHPDLFQLTGELDRKSGLEFLMGADVFCLPSGDESQPITPLEAASLGVPCALTDLPPYAGTWTHGRNCLLNPIGDTALLRWNIQGLLDDPALCAPIVQRARALSDQFGIEAFHQSFDAVMPVGRDPNR